MSHMVVRFRSGDQLKWGLLQSAAPHGPDDKLAVRELHVDAASTSALIFALDERSFVADAGEVISVRASDLVSPVSDDARLLCQGLNYATHAEEAGHAVRKANLFFMKASSSLTGPYADIVKPVATELLDYEVELGVILRRDLNMGDVVTADNVGDYIAGVTLCNDVSARDVMFGASFFQWFQGKSFRTFCPTGPAIYYLEPDEVADALENLEISLSLNGELRQRATTSDLIYKPAETLTQVAQFMDLSRGDMILTGTPGGVILQGSPELMDMFRRTLLDDVARRDEIRAAVKGTTRFLQAGDKLVLTLRNAKDGFDLGGHNSQIV